jgi:hypothetical protein
MLQADGHSIGTVSKQLVRAPFYGTPADYWMAAGLATGVVLSSTLDRTMRAEMRDRHDGWMTSVDDVGHVYSRVYCNFGLAGGLYAAGLIGDDVALRRTGMEIVEAFLAAHAGTQTVKRLVGRHRPYNDDGQYAFHGPTLKDRFLSFPSGDVTNAFTLSAVLADEIGHPAATVALYGLATTTAFQRWHRDKHWFSDTVAAAVWSVAVSRAVVRYHHAARSRLANGVELAPDLNGIHLVYNF